MQGTRTATIHLALATALLAAGALRAADGPPPAPPAPAVPTPLGERERAIHLLSRLAFGHRPGDVEKVAKDGSAAWVARQLEPEKIPDPAMDARLKKYESLGLGPRQLIDRYDIQPKEGSTPEEQKRVYEMREAPPRELAASVLLRACYSERRLEEVMVEFWRNHFNVSLNKDAVHFLATDYEREVIRKHVFGRFEDMLLASAKHPAMLLYLDNALSQKPLSEIEAKTIARAGKKKGQRLQDLERQRGLNENYARELLELHTLGVDNGYTQRDVTELARVLTGWTVDYRPAAEGGTLGFWFRPEVHDTGPKQVLTWVFNAKNGGADEGETAIRALARHKITARFIAWKMCRYLVADQPPEPLVDRVAEVFKKTHGDLREVTRAIVTDEAFFDRATWRAKFKTPFEFLVSAVRATGLEVDDPMPAVYGLGLMGQPIYRCDDPTGYFDTAEKWLDPGVLAIRWQIALSIADHVPPALFVPSQGGISLARHLQETLVPSGVGPATGRVLDDAARRITADPDAARRRLAAVLLGSSEFQKQ